MKILFLDDRQKRIDVAEERWKGHDLHVVRTVEETKEALKYGQPWDLVSLDHDLGGESFVNPRRPDCGMEVVRFLEKKRIKVGQIIVHSSNENMAVLMTKRLNASNYRTIRERFVYDVERS